MNRKYVSFMAMLILSALLISCLSEGDDPNKDLNKELKVIDAFLDSDPTVSAENILYENSSGIRFVFLNYGQGLVPKDNLEIDYTVTGSVLTSAGVGSPFINNASFTEDLEDISPPGLQRALKNMLGGSAARVYVPSRFAYGAEGDPSRNIPANAIIEYRVISNEVKRTSIQQTQFELDTAAIKDYIELHDPTAIGHPSGIWYSVDTEGAGANPTPFSSVNFDYELRLLTTPDKVTEKSTLSNQMILGKLIDGLAIAFQLMKPGATYTFYIPSGLAYGPSSQSAIPANTNLIFEIKLTSVNN